MKRGCLVTLLAAAALSVFASTATGGGTVVIAPADPSRSDCVPGSTPRYSGYAAESLTVLGCVEPARSGPVIVAADVNGAFACFYVSPPGSENGGPCSQVRSAKPPFGGKLTPAKRNSSPITGGQTISTVQVGRYGGDPYVSGLVPGNARDVLVSPGLIGAGPFYEPAELLTVPLPLATRIGATHSFKVFVVRLSPLFESCAGIHLVSHTSDGPLSADVGKGDRAFPSAPVPLPGASTCVTPEVWEIGEVMRDVAKALRVVMRRQS